MIVTCVHPDRSIGSSGVGEVMRRLIFSAGLVFAVLWPGAASAIVSNVEVKEGGEPLRTQTINIAVNNKSGRVIHRKPVQVRRTTTRVRRTPINIPDRVARQAESVRVEYVSRSGERREASVPWAVFVRGGSIDLSSFATTPGYPVGTASIPSGAFPASTQPPGSSLYGPHLYGFFGGTRHSAEAMELEGDFVTFRDRNSANGGSAGIGLDYSMTCGGFVCGVFIEGQRFGDDFVGETFPGGARIGYTANYLATGGLKLGIPLGEQRTGVSDPAAGNYMIYGKLGAAAFGVESEAFGWKADRTVWGFSGGVGLAGKPAAWPFSLFVELNGTWAGNVNFDWGGPVSYRSEDVSIVQIRGGLSLPLTHLWGMR